MTQILTAQEQLAKSTLADPASAAAALALAKAGFTALVSTDAGKRTFIEAVTGENFEALPRDRKTGRLNQFKPIFVALGAGAVSPAVKVVVDADITGDDVVAYSVKDRTVLVQDELEGLHLAEAVGRGFAMAIIEAISRVVKGKAIGPGQAAVRLGLALVGGDADIPRPWLTSDLLADKVVRTDLDAVKVAKAQLEAMVLAIDGRQRLVEALTGKDLDPLGEEEREAFIAPFAPLLNDIEDGKFDPRLELVPADSLPDGRAAQFSPEDGGVIRLARGLDPETLDNAANSVLAEAIVKTAALRTPGKITEPDLAIARCGGLQLASLVTDRKPWLMTELEVDQPDPSLQDSSPLGRVRLHGQMPLGVTLKRFGKPLPFDIDEAMANGMDVFWKNVKIATIYWKPSEYPYWQTNVPILKSIPDNDNYKSITITFMKCGSIGYCARAFFNSNVLYSNVSVPAGLRVKAIDRSGGASWWRYDRFDFKPGSTVDIHVINANGGDVAALRGHRWGANGIARGLNGWLVVGPNGKIEYRAYGERPSGFLGLAPIPRSATRLMIGGVSVDVTFPKGPANRPKVVVPDGFGFRFRFNQIHVYRLANLDHRQILSPGTLIEAAMRIRLARMNAGAPSPTGTEWWHGVATFWHRLVNHVDGDLDAASKVVSRAAHEMMHDADAVVEAARGVGRLLLAGGEAATGAMAELIGAVLKINTIRGYGRSLLASAAANAQRGINKFVAGALMGMLGCSTLEASDIMNKLALMLDLIRYGMKGSAGAVARQRLARFYGVCMQEFRKYQPDAAKLIGASPSKAVIQGINDYKNDVFFIGALELGWEVFARSPYMSYFQFRLYGVWQITNGWKFSIVFREFDVHGIVAKFSPFNQATDIADGGFLMIRDLIWQIYPDFKFNVRKTVGVYAELTPIGDSVIALIKKSSKGLREAATHLPNRAISNTIINVTETIEQRVDEMSAFRSTINEEDWNKLQTIAGKYFSGRAHEFEAGAYLGLSVTNNIYDIDGGYDDLQMRVAFLSFLGAAAFGVGLGVLLGLGTEGGIPPRTLIEIGGFAGSAVDVVVNILAAYHYEQDYKRNFDLSVNLVFWGAYMAVLKLALQGKFRGRVMVNDRLSWVLHDRKATSP